MFINAAPLGSTVDSLRDGERDLMAYVKEACERVEALDPDIEAMLPEPGRGERLIREAAALQKRFPDPESRPPLYGALVAVKDIFHVSGFLTRAGSAVPPALIAGAEATCVSLLRDAGALILGKSVTTEFAYFAPGPTRNPHNRNHTPGGSSSGSAAAVAAGFAPLALGTQTVGSVIRPAAFCGVIGFKPTLYRIPSKGLVHFSRSVDHVGLFTQDVAGMRLAASVLCQGWRDRGLTAAVPGAGPGSDFERVPEGSPGSVSPDALPLPVLAVPDGPYLKQTEPEALERFEEQAAYIQGNGYVVKRVPVFEHIDELKRLHQNLVYSEFAREHRRVYESHGHLLRPRTAQMVEEGMQVTDDDLHRARKHCTVLRSEIELLMASEAIDLWICPAATGPAPESIHATGSPDMNLPWTHTGMPVVTLPAGKAANGLPLGLQLVASFGADEYLLSRVQVMADRVDFASLDA